MRTSSVQVSCISVKALFNRSARLYLIPMYQRGYTWGKKEINRLLEDFFNAYVEWKKFRDTKQSLPYYLGTLVVMRHGKQWEVVDGQQRLTTLMLLSKCLKLGKMHTRSYIDFENRQDARDFLETFMTTEQTEDEQWTQSELFGEAIRRLQEKRIRNEFELHIATINGAQQYEYSEFLHFISEEVKLFQIELPENIDVSAYFEVMNTRGRQLEDHEILKARLIRKAKGEQGDITEIEFNRRWLWCSDFTKARAESEAEEYQKEEKNGDNNQSEEMKLENPSSWIPPDSSARFTFQEFLLIALGFYCGVVQQNEEIVISLNRANLIKTFDDVMNPQGASSLLPFSAQDFLFWMEVLRDYCDTHVVRSVKNGQGLLEWKSPVAWKENESKGQGAKLNEEILKLQSLLMVVQGPNLSWLKELVSSELKLKKEEVYNVRRKMLRACSENTQEKFKDVSNEYYKYISKDISQVTETCEILREVLRNIVYRVWNVQDKKTCFESSCMHFLRQGLSTPFIVLYTLDYLFWREWRKGSEKDTELSVEEKRKVVDKFVFRDRDSREHFYPQHPKFPAPGGASWSVGNVLDSIGNLYLTTPRQNSTMSHDSPREKVDYWERNNLDETPKQALMYAIARQDKNWWTTPVACRNHEMRCCELLKEFLFDEKAR